MALAATRTSLDGKRRNYDVVAAMFPDVRGETFAGMELAIAAKELASACDQCLKTLASVGQMIGGENSVRHVTKNTDSP